MSLCKAFVLIVAILLAPFAFATLGQPAKSIDNDGQQMKAKAGQIETYKGVQVRVFTVHTVVIKQFVGSDGVVFAVSWRGLRHPKLKALLGEYFQSYLEADGKIKKGRRFIHQDVNSGDLVVARGGHPPHLHGAAYLKSKMPAGWTQEDLL